MILKMVVKSIFIQYLSKMVTFPLSLVIYSILVKNLSIVEFKDYNLFLAVTIYMLGFIDLGMGNFFYRESILTKNYYFFNFLLNFKIFMFFLLILIYLFFFKIFNFQLTILLILYLFFNILKDILEKILRSFSKFNYISYVNIYTILFQFMIILYLFFHKKLCLTSVLISLILSIIFNIILIKFSLKKLRKKFTFRINYKYLIYTYLLVKKNFKYIFPWIIIFLSNIIFSRLDIFMLNYFNLFYSVSEYSSSYNLYEKLEFFLLAISMVFYNFFSQNKNLKVFSLILNIMTLISLMFIISLLFLSDFLIYLIIGNKYIYSKKLFIIMVLGTYFKFYTTFFVNWLYLHKKEFIVSIGAILILLLNGVLNYIFIPEYKDLGAAYTTLISDFFNFIFFIYAMYKLNFKFATKFFLFFNLFYIIGVVFYFYVQNYTIFLLLFIFQIVFFIINIKNYAFLKGLL